MSLQLPTPLSPTLVIVGGDAKMHEIKEAWQAAYILISTRISKFPTGSLVLAGPQSGAPDELASDSVRFSSKQHSFVTFCRDGRALASAHFSTDKGVKTPYYRRYCGMWSTNPTPEGLSMELAQQAALSKAAGWDVEVLIVHGWDGSFRGERLAERMRHLGVSPKEWDVSKQGRLIER